jgi:hypothetical protein
MPPAAGPVGVIVAPTRELAIQISEEAVKFGKTSGIVSACVYGGVPKGPQMYAVMRGVHVIIATPGATVGSWNIALAPAPLSHALHPSLPCDWAPVRVSVHLHYRLSCREAERLPHDEVLQDGQAPDQPRPLHLRGAGRGGPHARHGLRAPDQGDHRQGESTALRRTGCHHPHPHPSPPLQLLLHTGVPALRPTGR